MEPERTLLGRVADARQDQRQPVARQHVQIDRRCTAGRRRAAEQPAPALLQRDAFEREDGGLCHGLRQVGAWDARHKSAFAPKGWVGRGRFSAAKAGRVQRRGQPEELHP